MTRTPAIHRARSHAELREELLQEAQERFSTLPGTAWRPLDAFGVDRRDPGAGLLDAVALALRVLWIYQEAWADETFLGTAHLGSSVRRLLHHIDYQPSPGTASVGLQHFECRINDRGTLPRGFKVRAPGDRERPETTFETLHPLELRPDLNEIQPWNPLPDGTAQDDVDRPAKPFPGAGGVLGGVGDPPSAYPGQPKTPVAGTYLTPTDATSALQARLLHHRGGPIADRRLAHARSRAKQLMDLMEELGQYGANEECKKALCDACDELMKAQAEAAKIARIRPGPLSESQEMVGRLLQQLRGRREPTYEALERALAPHPGSPPACPGESAEEWAERLDAMLAFLDGFVATLIQQARSQIVLLHGRDALTRLDDFYGNEDRRRFLMGRARAGDEQVHLVHAEEGVPKWGAFEAIRPGDWLAVAVVDERVDIDGTVTRTRRFQEAIRVVDVEVVRFGHVATQSRSRITFTPKLKNNYELARTALVGNLARISHGEVVVEDAELDPRRRVATLTQRPLTWLRAPGRPAGREPALDVTVDGRPWTRVPTLLGVDREAASYALRSDPDGGHSVLFGDGREGAALRPDAQVELRYRVGVGQAANLEARAVSELGDAHAAVTRTWNPLPLDDGTDPEPTEEARTRGPRAIRALDRAVSVADVRAVALAYDGVERAAVRRDAAFRRGQLDVVVAGPRVRALAPAELGKLRTHLQRRVAPGVVIAVRNRRVLQVHAHIELHKDAIADPVELKQAVRLRLGFIEAAGVPPGLLDPRVVQLGGWLRLSDLYGALDGVPELRSFVVKAFERRGTPGLASAVRVADDHVPRWARGGLTLTTATARDLS